MKKTFISVVSIAFFALFGVVFAQESGGVRKMSGGDIMVEAVGLGINASEAMINAKRDAVEKGIGTFIQSETEVKNFMVSKDVILTRTMGAVKSVKKISETKGPDGVITIKINAVVSTSKIHDNLAALRILLESMDKPRIMVMIKESNVGKNVLSNSTSETEIIKYLTEKGFDVVDPIVVSKLKQEKKSVLAMEGNSATAATIGADAGAEIIITGTAVSRVADGMQEMLGNMKSCQADVSIKVIVCSTAKIIAAKNGHSAVVHVSPLAGGNIAIAKASKKVMDKYIFEKIVSSWQDVINNGVLLKVAVNNVKVFSASKATINAIKNSSTSVVRVIKRKWNRKSGVLDLEVKYKGNSDGFCEVVDGFSVNNKYKLAVTGNTSNSVMLKIEVQ